MDLAILADAPSTPTGLAISPSGRVFVMMPRFTARSLSPSARWRPTVRLTPYPDAGINTPDPERPQATLFHVPNGVFDTEGKLWLLDAGLPNGSGPPVPGATKLVQMDIETGEILRVVPLDPGVEKTSSLNDLRVDTAGWPSAGLCHGSGPRWTGRDLAVDLGSGRVVRRLGSHASTKSQRGCRSSWSIAPQSCATTARQAGAHPGRCERHRARAGRQASLYYAP